MTDSSLKKQFLMLIDAGFHQITHLGSMTLTTILVLFMLFFSWDLAIRIILGIVGVTIISYLIKMFTFKKRPKARPTGSFIEKIDASSFPSVHSARITAIVFWMVVLFSNMYLSIFSIVIGLLVIYSRVYLKEHYWTDVLGGVFISLIINVIILIFGSAL